MPCVLFFDSEVKALLSNGDYDYTLIIDEEPTVILDCIDQNTPKNVANRELQELNLCHAESAGLFVDE